MLFTMAFSGGCITFKPLSTAGSIHIVVDGKLQRSEGMLKLVSSMSIQVIEIVGAHKTIVNQSDIQHLK